MRAQSDGENAHTPTPCASMASKYLKIINVQKKSTGSQWEELADLTLLFDIFISAFH